MLAAVCRLQTRCSSLYPSSMEISIYFLHLTIYYCIICTNISALEQKPGTRRLLPEVHMCSIKVHHWHSSDVLHKKDKTQL